jgi:hypothetical protein
MICVPRRRRFCHKFFESDMPLIPKIEECDVLCTLEEEMYPTCDVPMTHIGEWPRKEQN